MYELKKFYRITSYEGSYVVLKLFFQYLLLVIGERENRLVRLITPPMSLSASMFGLKDDKVYFFPQMK